jgi:hypothetical protein
MSTGTLIVPVNSASVGLRCFVRHRLEGAVQCSACSNVRAALKQVVFPPFRHLLFRIATYDWNILERRISGINGQNQRASRINEHLSACALPKRNIVHRGNFASIPCWTSFTAIFPLASSVDTASGINGQQHEDPAHMSADWLSSGLRLIFYQGGVLPAIPHRLPRTVQTKRSLLAPNLPAGVRISACAEG